MQLNLHPECGWVSLCGDKKVWSWWTAKDWVAGFVGFLGDMSVLQAELVAMSYGLDLAWDRGVRCFSDSMVAVLLLTRPVDLRHCSGARAFEQKLGCAREALVA